MDLAGIEPCSVAGAAASVPPNLRMHPAGDGATALASDVRRAFEASKQTREEAKGAHGSTDDQVGSCFGRANL